MKDQDHIKQNAISLMLSMTVVEVRDLLEGKEWLAKHCCYSDNAATQSAVSLQLDTGKAFKKQVQVHCGQAEQ